MALAIAYIDGSNQLNNYCIVSRVAAERQGMLALWLSLYQKVEVAYLEDAIYGDIDVLATACARMEGPGAIPVADWLIHMYPRKREPPTGIDVMILGTMHARRTRTREAKAAKLQARLAHTQARDEAVIDASIEEAIAAEVDRPAPTLYLH